MDPVRPIRQQSGAPRPSAGLGEDVPGRYARAVAANTPNSALFVVDRDMRFVFVEGPLGCTTDWQPERLVGRTVADVCREFPDAPLVPDRLTRALAGGASSHEALWGPHVVWVRYQPVMDDTGAVEAVTATCLDLDGPLRDSRLHAFDQHVSDVLWIRARRQAEVALATERQRLEHALEAAQLGTWERNFRTGRTAFDARARAHYDIDRPDVSHEEALARVHPNDRARLAAAIALEISPAGRGSAKTEYRVVHRDGTVRTLSVHVRLEYAGEGDLRTVLRMFGTSQDITEQRRAEEHAEQQHLLLREAGEIAHLGGWEFDPVTGEGSWTEETARIHGISGSLPPASSGFERFDGEAREQIEAAVAAAVRDGTPYDLELPFTAADGVHKWVRAVCHPVVDQGRVVRVRGALQDITVRKQAETALERFVAASPSLIYALAVTPSGVSLIWMGGNVEHLTGWTSEESSTPGWWRDNIHPDDLGRVLASSPTPYEIEQLAIEFRFRRKDGTYVWIRDERRLLRDANGRATEVVGSWSDVTERITLENQLRQSQKLEAIGQLAGGVAHDFNNILTVVSGNSELLAAALHGRGAEQVLIGEILDASQRAAALTRQLLAFSRAQVLAPQVVDVNAAVSHLDKMLRRLLGEHITLHCQLAPDAGRILVDVGQFEQVLVNLAVNARDAMPAGGSMTMATEAVELDEAYVRLHADVAVGRYVRVTISDTGAGMTTDVRSRIFEPFFTTKEPGRGTGLGLATVFGIVKQSGGHIEVYSEAGEGAVFKVYFPQVDGVGQAAASSPPETAPRGTERILLVEDEAAVRRLALLALTGHGYTVVEAHDGLAALAAAAEMGHIDLLITDLVMPQMGGSDIAAALRVRRPGLKVLFMSGYVHDALLRHGLAESDDAFINKPFTIAALARKVRDVLDDAPAARD